MIVICLYQPCYALSAQCSVDIQRRQMGFDSPLCSQAGIAGMTLPMARDLSRHGVRVNTIAPGTFGTPMTVGLEQGKGKKVGDGLKSAQLFPSKRFGEHWRCAFPYELCVCWAPFMRPLVAS